MTNTKRMIVGTSMSMGGTVYWSDGGWTRRMDRASVNDDATEGGAGRTERNLRLATCAALRQYIENVRVVSAEAVRS